MIELPKKGDRIKILDNCSNTRINVGDVCELQRDAYIGMNGYIYMKLANGIEWGCRIKDFQFVQEPTEVYVPKDIHGATPDPKAEYEKAARRLERLSAEVLLSTKADPVNHPSHYTQGKVECIDALEAATADLKGIEAVCTANAIKYLWRWKGKNGKQDLQKAKWYLDKLISHIDKEPG